jgi:ribosome biogenesis GTPase
VTGEEHGGTRRTTRAPGVDAFAVLGWDATWAEVFVMLPGTPARVTRMDHGRARALTRSGPVSATPAGDLDRLVTGDWVAITGDDTGPATVTAMARRRTALVRRDPGEEPAPQALAANMDQVWITHAAGHPLRAGWLDRALVVAYGSGATPVIVVTKADLAPDVGTLTNEIAALAPGVALVVTSTIDGRGLDTLGTRLQGGRCAALLGRSGAGKSSLVNALSGGTDQRTGTVRTTDGRGRHTTTRRALVTVGGGSVIDTPGLRALGLWEPEMGLRLAFPEISELAASCRFNDCRHQNEPDCAVLLARDTGRLSSDRYRRYITLSIPDQTQRR